MGETRLHTFAARNLIPQTTRARLKTVTIETETLGVFLFYEYGTDVGGVFTPIPGQLKQVSIPLADITPGRLTAIRAILDSFHTYAITSNVL